MDELYEIIERGLSLCSRGRTLNAQWEKSGSGTPKAWADEVYDDQLTQWEIDARKLVNKRPVHCATFDEQVISEKDRAKVGDILDSLGTPDKQRPLSEAKK